MIRRRATCDRPMARRIAALLKRERRADGFAPVNAKRVYRLMKKHETTCCSSEAISWVATTGGISSEMIRDMIVRCIDLGRDPRAAPGAVAVRQRLLRRPPNH